LLRHPRVASSLRDLSEGSWQPVLDDPDAGPQPESVRRLVLCTGKVAIDLADSPSRRETPEIAIVRIEQLCPFPAAEVQNIINHYPALSELVWAQEEPENMGAWAFVQPKISGLASSRLPLRFIGRSASPSPSEGSLSWHLINQRTLVDQVFKMTLPIMG
jgi:2-oxoglutarate dehydrogenase E1 component